MGVAQLFLGALAFGDVVGGCRRCRAPSGCRGDCSPWPRTTASSPSECRSRISLFMPRRSDPRISGSRPRMSARSSGCIISAADRKRNSAAEVPRILSKAGLTYVRRPSVSDTMMMSLASCIGAVAVAPCNPSVIYVGTGESDMRSDIAYGNGMYKSTDTGKSWAHIGLTDSQQICAHFG